MRNSVTRKVAVTGVLCMGGGVGEEKGGGEGCTYRVGSRVYDSIFPKHVCLLWHCVSIRKILNKLKLFKQLFFFLSCCYFCGKASGRDVARFITKCNVLVRGICFFFFFFCYPAVNFDLICSGCCHCVM